MTNPAAEPAVGPAENYFQAGKPAAHPYGVLYQGEYETPWDGTATAVRLHARALAATGVPLLLKSFSNVVVSAEGAIDPLHTVGLPPEVRAEVGHLRETSIGTWAPLIKHVVIRSGEHARNIALPRGVEHSDPAMMLTMREAICRATILFTVWERDRVSKPIAQILNRVAQCWVPCRQNADMLIASGVDADRVRVVPHPYEPTDVLCRFTSRAPMKERRFYTIGRWEPRKGMHELLGAFLLAFKPGGDASLVMKFSGGQWQGYPSPEQSAEHWLEQPSVRSQGWDVDSLRLHVTFLGRKMSADKIRELHFRNNIYVSSGKGEAWCLPAFAAKLAGNRLVHVPWGGTADFADPEQDIRIPYAMEPVHASYQWEPGSQWASYDVMKLAYALCQAQAPTVFARPAGFEQRFSMQAVGRQMLELALGVADNADPRAAEYLRGMVQK